jgi:hypothetical protein
MSTPFAAAQSRLGQSTVRRQANALMALPGGQQVAGIFRQDAAQGSVGTAGMSSRDVTFRCLSADLTAALIKGSQVSVTFRGENTTWLVAKATEQHELGQMLYELEQP